MWTIKPMPLITVTGKMLIIIVVSTVFNLFIGAEANCEIPPSPERGTLHLVGDPKVDTLALYSCDDGWKLVGASASKCLNTGQWTSPPPKCVAEKGSSILTTATTPAVTPTTMESALLKHKAISEEDEAQYPSLTPDQTQENTCSCTCNSHERNFSVEVTGLWLWNEDKVRKSNKMTLRCYDQERRLVLTNATSISGTSILTCEVCRIGEDGDIYSCEDILLGPDVLCPPIPGTEVLVVNFTNDRKINSTAHFSCKDSNSKIISGLDTRTCLPSGEWSGTNPDCVDPCSIPFVPNGMIGKWVTQRYSRGQKYQKIPVGQRIEDDEILFLHCDNGYRPLGITTNWQAMVTCKGGKWSKDPFCELSTCDSEPPEAENGRVEKMERKHGGMVTYVCLPNFNKVKTGNVNCNMGEWKGVPPSCKDAPPCPSASISEVIPKNVIYDKDDVTNSTMPYNSTVKLECLGGKTLVGNSFARCESGGNWEVGNITCISGCPPFVKGTGSGLFIKPQKDVYKIGDYVTLSCTLGQKLSADLVIVMCLQSGWSESALPKCITSDAIVDEENQASGS